MINTVLSTILTITLGITPSFEVPKTPELTIASHEFSLEKRYGVQSVNEVFKKNILLNLAYLKESVNDKKDIKWDEVLASSEYSFELKPKETFAYHDEVLDEYAGKVSKTIDVSFGPGDGFVSDGYLYGDGVCHLASLINWVAQDAGLEVKVTKDHDFAAIPEVPSEYGVSIYVDPSNKAISSNRNLYITNNKEKPVRFVFRYADGQLKVSAVELG